MPDKKGTPTQAAAATSDGWEDVPSASGGNDGWADVPQGGGAAPSVPPRPQGMLSRYEGSLRSAMGLTPEYTSLTDDISQVGTGAYNAVRHPIDTARNIGKAQEDVFNKAATEVRDPDPWTKAKGVVRGVESGIPLVGPLLSRAGDQFAEGDYAGGAGTMTPMLAPEMGEVKPTLAKVMRRPDNTLRTPFSMGAKVGGIVGGHELGGWPGMLVGRDIAPRLMEEMAPERAPERASLMGGRTAPRPRGFGAYEDPEAAAAGGRGPGGGEGAGTGNPGSGVTRLPIRNTPFDAPLTPEQIPGPDSGPNNRLETIAKTGDPRAGRELQRRGQQVIYAPETDTGRGSSLLDEMNRGPAAPPARYTDPIATWEGEGGGTGNAPVPVNEGGGLPGGEGTADRRQTIMDASELVRRGMAERRSPNTPEGLPRLVEELRPKGGAGNAGGDTPIFDDVRKRLAERMQEGEQ